MRVTSESVDSSGGKWVECDQNSQVAQMCSIAAKPQRGPTPLPDSFVGPRQKEPRKVKPEPLEENTFLIRLDNSADGLHEKVVERLVGEGLHRD